jgi:hypothetical protein
MSRVLCVIVAKSAGHIWILIERSSLLLCVLTQTLKSRAGVLDVTRLQFKDGIQLNGLPAPLARHS